MCGPPALALAAAGLAAAGTLASGVSQSTQYRYQAKVADRKTLDVIERSNGLTADEVAGRLGISILSIRPRVTELARLGKVRDSGERRTNVSGRRAIVWKPVFPARLRGQRS